MEVGQRILTNPATNLENIAFVSDRQYSSSTLQLASDVLPRSMSPVTSSYTSAIPGGFETMRSSSGPQQPNVTLPSIRTIIGSPQSSNHVSSQVAIDHQQQNKTVTEVSLSPRTDVPRPYSNTGPFYDLLMELPCDNDLDVLVEVYFEKVHWFLLVFHQGWFRERLSNFRHDRKIGAAEKENDFQFLCLLMTILILAMKTSTQEFQVAQYISFDKSSPLADLYVSVIQQQTFQIIQQPTLQSVQVLILLANYYLWHGSPNLAWPTLGMAIRNAQVLKLHRKVSPGESTTAELCPGVTLQDARKRCWWTLYDLDRFCAMVYGYPMGINDEDCDVELPEDPLHPLQTKPRNDPTSFLSYKVHLSKLSVIIGDVLTQLYRPSRVPKSKNGEDAQNLRSEIRRMMLQTSRLNIRLKKWQEALPTRLRLDWKVLDPVGSENSKSISSDASDFEDYIFKMQALSLQLAFDNAIILAHRPSLSMNLAKHSQTSTVLSTLARHVSIASQKCRDAALRTSRLEAHPSIIVSRNTHAAAYIGLNLLSAGIVLCLLTSNGLHGSKLKEDVAAINRIFQMFRQFKGTSPLVVQGHELLKVLVRSVLKDEFGSSIVFPEDDQQKPQADGNESPTEPRLREPLDAPENPASQSIPSRSPPIDSIEDFSNPVEMADSQVEMSNQEIEELFAGLEQNLEFPFDDAVHVDLSDARGLFSTADSTRAFHDPTWIWDLSDFRDLDSF
ncbi:tall aerial hyphae-4 [Phlyctema vagabunda]|uniref:Tall aerial hyphae-4 n=1 Tax=Phlyctema vagabunda TaxID=108571 RepID=A0ABR4PVD7_9HELO